MNHEPIDPDLLRTKIAQEATYLINTGMLTPIPHPFVVVEPRSNKAKAGGLHVLYVAVSSLLSGSDKLGMDYIDTPEFRKRLGGMDRAAPWLRLSNAMGMPVLDLMTLDSLCLGSPSNFGMKGMQQAAWAQAHTMNAMWLSIPERHLQALQALKDFRELPKRPNGTVDWDAALPEGDEGEARGLSGSAPIPPEPFELFQWNDLVWARFLVWMRTQDRALESRLRQVSRLRSLYWAAYRWPGTEEGERFLSATHDPTLFQQHMEDVQGLIFYEQDLKRLPGYEWWARYNDGLDLLQKIGPKILWRGEVRGLRSTGITPPRQGSSLSLLAPRLSSGSMSKVKIEIEDDGRVMVYVDEKLVPALVNIDFANVRDGYKAAVLVVPKGDPRAEATIDALLEANGTRVVNPLYVEEDEYEEVQMDAVRRRMTEEMRKEAEPIRIKMENVPDLVAWKKQVAEALSKIKEGPAYSPIFQSPEELALGRWTQTFPGQGVNRVRGVPRLSMILDEASTPAERQRARELLSEESAKGPFTVTPIAPKVPGPYSDTGTRPMPQEKQAVNLPLLEKHISSANDGTKGLLTHFTLNGLKIEDVLRAEITASGPYKRVELLAPSGDPRIPGVMTVVYEDEICLLTFVNRPLSKSPQAHWLDKMAEGSRSSETARRFQDELKAEIQKMREMKSGLKEALVGVVESIATDPYLSQLQRPIDRTTPELTVERNLDGSLSLLVNEKYDYSILGVHEEMTPLGPVFFQYLDETDKRLSMPITLVRYQDKPALMVYATKRS